MTHIETPDSPLSRAVEHFGSGAALARALGVVPMTVSQWSRRGVPVGRAIEIENLTGGAIAAAELRPDVFRKQ